MLTDTELVILPSEFDDAEPPAFQFHDTKFKLLHSNRKRKEILSLRHAYLEKYAKNIFDDFINIKIKEWKNSTFSMALVVNLKEDYKFRVSQWEPLEAHKDLPLTILRDHNWTITKDMEKQYEELCSEKTKVLSMNRQANIWNGNWNYLHQSHKKTEVSNLFDNTPRVLALEQIKKVPNDAMVMNEIKEELLSEIEDLHNNYTTAQLDFKTYKTHIDTLNKLLISKEAGMTVKKYNSHKKLVEAIAKNHSHEFIKYKDKATEVAYENAEEISIYNQGYFH